MQRRLICSVKIATKKREEHIRTSRLHRYRVKTCVGGKVRGKRQATLPWIHEDMHSEPDRQAGKLDTRHAVPYLGYEPYALGTGTKLL